MKMLCEVPMWTSLSSHISRESLITRLPALGLPDHNSESYQIKTTLEHCFLRYALLIRSTGLIVTPRLASAMAGLISLKS